MSTANCSDPSAGYGLCWAHPRNDSKDQILKCFIPATLPQTDDTATALLMFRMDAIKRRDDMLALQKDCAASGDRDGARFFKSESADALRDYRAVCLLIPYVCATELGDCPLRDVWQWPSELGRHVMRAASYAELLQ